MDGHIRAGCSLKPDIRRTNIQVVEVANRIGVGRASCQIAPYIQDTQQLHNMPFKGRVKITKDANGVYDDRSELKSYKPINFVVPGSVAPMGAPAGAPQTAPQMAPQQAPQGWAPQVAVAGLRVIRIRRDYTFPDGMHPATPSRSPQQPPNGGWQQPQQAQPWSQPQQAAPQVQQAPQQATPLPPVQFAPNPQQAAPQQAAPQGFAAPTQQSAPQQAPQAAPQPQDPAVAAAQNASPPWAKQG